MDKEITKELFKYYLERFTRYFQNPDPYELKNLKEEIDSLDRDQVIEKWLLLLRYQGPVEKVSPNKYEAYDVNNFVGEENLNPKNYIHTVELIDNENTASVFMKFYYVFCCLANGIKNDSYQSDRKG
ncbi:MAG: hypothetical protein H7263_08670 [Candidatus Sericytochromatia bacterium]|nr:hypothetical protein [Candidatus Sericytochromatia bacterium]